jgi:alpha-N-arabinofuranosidase
MKDGLEMSSRRVLNKGLGMVFLALVALGIFLSWGSLSAASNPKKGKNMMTFRNPILSGFHPDPSVCRVGGDFYLVNSTFEFFPGLPIYHSRDLVHWEQIGNALDRPSQLPLKGATDNGGLYAPTIRYHKGTFYLTCTNVSGGGNFIVTAKDPKGPWSEPVWNDVPDIDGSMFFDDDGKAYYTSQGGGEKAGIKQCEFDPTTCKITSASKVIHNDLAESWNEGPHLYKIKGKYYLMVAEGGTGTQHMEWMGRSDSPWGPFAPCPYNPILTERDEPSSPIQCTGHADLVEAPDGTWWMVFLGVRMHDGMSVLGRETFLAPVEWKDGWPVVNGDHHVALEMPAPKLKSHPYPTLGPRWVFDGKALGPEWIHVRNVDPNDISLKERKGCLSLHAGLGGISDQKDVPAFAGQRQPNFVMTTRCAMEFTPGADGEEAGLMVRANDNNHYEVAVGRWGGETMILVRNRVGGQESLVATRPFKGGKVFLELSGQVSQYQFAWSTDGKTWETLAASDATDLSKERAGGFTGAVLGLYATANRKVSTNWAHFDRFEMTPGVAPKPIVLAARPTPTPVPPREAWRVRCGGESVKDSGGNTWEADEAYFGGETAFTGRPIVAKKDEALFQGERWGSDYSYIFPVTGKKYQVRLLFAETYLKNPGERQFDCFINNKLVLKDFDILKEAGGFDRGIERTFEDVVPDAQGVIRVRFLARVQNAKVCAIEVLRQAPGAY